VTLIFDLLTLKLVHVIACGWATFIPILMLTFRYRFMGQHLSDAPRAIITLTFDLESGAHYSPA